MEQEVEWDEIKAESNEAKHGVTFDEAAGVINDSMALIFDDPAHSSEEDRSVAIGYSPASRLLLVVFTQRDGLIRIISARPVTKGERKRYENEPR